VASVETEQYQWLLIPPPVPPMRRRRFPRVSAEALTALGSIACAIGLWWLIAIVIIRDPLLLPTPRSVFGNLLHLMNTRGSFNLWSNIWASVKRVLIGWIIGVTAGISVGVLMALDRRIAALFDPLVEFGRPIPPLAYAPLLVVWLGIGETSKVVVLILAALPVMIISTVSAIHNVNESWKRAARTLGASPFYLTTRVIIPAALPEIFTAMRISNGLVWGTLIAAEIIASSSGLGWMILQASRYLETETVIAGIVVIGTLAFLADQVLRRIQARLIPWKGRQ
jgi:taurine transport system permease protein